jgi:hypothetical protein
MGDPKPPDKKSTVARTFVSNGVSMMKHLARLKSKSAFFSAA